MLKSLSFILISLFLVSCTSLTMFLDPEVVKIAEELPVQIVEDVEEDLGVDTTAYSAYGLFALIPLAAFLIGARYLNNRTINVANITNPST